MQAEQVHLDCIDLTLIKGQGDDNYIVMKF